MFEVEGVSISQDGGIRPLLE